MGAKFEEPGPFLPFFSGVKTVSFTGTFFNRGVSDHFSRYPLSV